MATLESDQTSAVARRVIAGLVIEAVSLNASLGDPTDVLLAEGQTRPNNRLQRTAGPRRR
jgi:hypothetical protein